MTATFHDLALLGYEWESSLTPYSDADPGLAFRYPLIGAPSSGYLTEYPVNGTRLDVEQRIQFSTFVAGALVGVAGALFIAALQELLAALRRQRPSPAPVSPNR